MTDQFEKCKAAALKVIREDMDKTWAQMSRIERTMAGSLDEAFEAHVGVVDMVVQSCLETLGLVTSPQACNKAPSGWYCTREEGHEGPCAADRMMTPWTEPGPSVPVTPEVSGGANKVIDLIIALCRIDVLKPIYFRQKESKDLQVGGTVTEYKDLVVVETVMMFEQEAP